MPRVVTFHAVINDRAGVNGSGRMVRWTTMAMLAGGSRGVGQRPTAPRPVRPGIDVLLSDSMALVRGRRVGLLTNVAAVDARGVTDIARLQQAGVRLVALFAPEHGLEARLPPGAVVANDSETAGHLPVYSLYGRTTTPTSAMLAGIDVILVDLPDVGARYFTYLATTIAMMRAAGSRGIPVVVLDRPDPIGGAMQGNVLDTAYASIVGPLAMPMRTGLTAGEAARLARADLGIAVDLRVVPANGWHRDEYLDQAGLPFRAPSPNLPRLEALFDYPGLCLFEGTALSVGRGTDPPFEMSARRGSTPPRCWRGSARRTCQACASRPSCSRRITPATPSSPTPPSAVSGDRDRSATLRSHPSPPSISWPPCSPSIPAGSASGGRSTALPAVRASSRAACR